MPQLFRIGRIARSFGRMRFDIYAIYDDLMSWLYEAASFHIAATWA